MTDLDLKSRQFATGMVKQYCTALYGKPPANDVWGNWRKWAGLQKRIKTFTFEQFCFVAAVAKIRRQWGNPKRQLRESEILALAESVEHQQELAEAIAHLDSLGLVLGFDAVAALSDRGIETNSKALYRKVPGFSFYTVYQVEFLETMVS